MTTRSPLSPVPMPLTDDANFDPVLSLVILISPSFSRLNLSPHSSLIFVVHHQFAELGVVSLGQTSCEYEKLTYRRCAMPIGPHSQAGQNTLTISDFIDPGGTLISNRVILPKVTASRCSQIA